MKFAPIVPHPMLTSIEADGYDYHMVLAGQCHMNGYTWFYREAAQGWKILDNGAAEGDMVSMYELCQIAKYIKADEVVAPDVMHEMVGTIVKLKEFCDYVKREVDWPGIAIMAVLQATTWVEFDVMLDAALALDVAAVALPKLLTKHLGPTARLAAADLIRSKERIPIHCLGAPTRLAEAKDLARQGIVRGIDTSGPVVLGLQNKGIKHTKYDWEVSHSAIPDFWGHPMTEQVKQNLDDFRRWCSVGN